MAEITASNNMLDFLKKKKWLAQTLEWNAGQSNKRSLHLFLWITQYTTIAQSKDYANQFAIETKTFFSFVVAYDWKPTRDWLHYIFFFSMICVRFCLLFYLTVFKRRKLYMCSRQNDREYCRNRWLCSTDAHKYKKNKCNLNFNSQRERNKIITLHSSGKNKTETRNANRNNRNAISIWWRSKNKHNECKIFDLIAFDFNGSIWLLRLLAAECSECNLSHFKTFDLDLMSFRLYVIRAQFSHFV